MHTIEKNRADSCHDSGYLVPVQGTREIAFKRVQFYKFPGGCMPPDLPPPSQEFVVPDNVRASGANGARPPAEPLHPVLPNATENPGRVDSSLL